MRHRLNYVQKNCIASAGKLLHQSGILFAGARIAVAVSGGVDSAVLLEVLRHRQRILPFPIELTCFHINPGFDHELHRKVRDWVATLGLAGVFEKTEFGPRAFSEENRSNSPCFLCSSWRRTRLFDLCRQYGCTHLALGHHADDQAVTFFMNLFDNGRVDGLAPVESFFQGRLQVIRPLLWLEKSQLKRAARAWGLPVFENPCPASKEDAQGLALSNRARITQWIREQVSADPSRKANVYNALRRHALARGARMPGVEPGVTSGGKPGGMSGES
ncbi:MAG: tRNA 2-thiocytidine biosynthesis TtcA family protein [Desulfovibrio sp.]|nr:tRNA 2-thiocytidine biosynthesis TtcA family protein [Desulfovibrio sp.]MCA1986184.1 tRNA 2-thiocytidine biosynthesis TtcA family protein [Desulfovibrio sp.]